MSDIQAVRLRKVLPVRQYDYVSVLRLIPGKPHTVAAAKVAGVDVPFVDVGDGTVLVFPTLLAGATTPAVRLEYTDDSGDYIASEVKAALPPGTEATVAGDVRIVDTAIRVHANDMDKVEEIVVNGLSRPFSTLSRTTAYVALTATDSAVAAVTLIGAATQFSTKSGFDYSLSSKGPRAVSGELKAVGQLIKVLLATPGTNVFDKRAPAAGLRTISGINSNGKDSASVVAVVVGRIQAAAALLIARQSSSDNDSSERIIAVTPLKVAEQRGDTNRIGVTLEVLFASRQRIAFDFIAQAAQAFAG
jgi:hypothetical protein